jgi:hypothetical protein
MQLPNTDLIPVYFHRLDIVGHVAADYSPQPNVATHDSVFECRYRFVGCLCLGIDPPRTAMAPGSGMKISIGLDFIGERGL